VEAGPFCTGYILAVQSSLHRDEPGGGGAFLHRDAVTLAGDGQIALGDASRCGTVWQRPAASGHLATSGNAGNVWQRWQCLATLAMSGNSANCLATPPMSGNAGNVWQRWQCRESVERNRGSPCQRCQRAGAWVVTSRVCIYVAPCNQPINPFCLGTPMWRGFIWRKTIILVGAFPKFKANNTFW